MFRSRRIVVLTLASSAVALACGQPAPERADETSASIASTPLPPDPARALVYDAYVGVAGCGSVPTSLGTWVAAPTFANDTGFCSYTWRGSAEADPTALTDALSATGVDPARVYRDDTCNAEACPRPSALPGNLTSGSGDPGGSVHCVKCTVATIVKTAQGPELHVVLPPSMVTAEPTSLQVGISDTYGAWIAQPGNAQVFTALLPGLPDMAGLASVTAPGVEGAGD
jgi:hypothetical protein